MKLLAGIGSVVVSAFSIALYVAGVIVLSAGLTAIDPKPNTFRLWIEGTFILLYPVLWPMVINSAIRNAWNKEVKNAK